MPTDSDLLRRLLEPIALQNFAPLNSIDRLRLIASHLAQFGIGSQCTDGLDAQVDVMG